MEKPSLESIVSLTSVQYPEVVALWTDNRTRIHNFEHLLDRWQTHPILSKLRGADVFNTVSVEAGTLVWKGIKLLEDDQHVVPVSDNYFSLSPSMLFRDGVVVSEFKPQSRLAKAIKELRQSYQLTQEQLATRVGMRKTYISRIERGLTDINYGTFEWILEIGFGKTLTIADLQEHDNPNWEKVEQTS